MAKRVCRQARELCNVRFSSHVVPPSQTGSGRGSDAGREARAPEPYYWALALVPLHDLYYRSMVYCLALTGSGDSSGGSSDSCCSGSERRAKNASKLRLTFVHSLGLGPRRMPGSTI